MTGIGTLLQLKSTRLTGIAMPVVLGSAIQSVSPLINIGGTLGIGKKRVWCDHFSGGLRIFDCGPICAIT